MRLNCPKLAMKSDSPLPTSVDQITADGFALSWNNKPPVYSMEQFTDWLEPLDGEDFENKSVLELGCGNGSLLFHLINWAPSQIIGVDLGDGIIQARKNLSVFPTIQILQGDLVTFTSKRFDAVLCIGVLHHLENPKHGLDSVVRNTTPGGRFHCWVYGYEGNQLARLFVEPLRKVCRYLPWRVTDFIAVAAVAPYWMYAKLLAKFKRLTWLRKLPMYQYSIWISKENFAFFRHMAFDQLIAYRTTYIRRSTIEAWLASYETIVKDTIYVIQRNGNSWKFGAKTKMI